MSVLPARPLHRRAHAVATTAVVVAVLIAPAVAVTSPAQAAKSPQPTSPAPNVVKASGIERSGALSSRLSRLAEAELADASPRRQARALDLPVSGAGSIIRDTEARVLVLVRLTDTGPATVERVGALGEVVNVSEAMSRLTLRIATSRLHALGATAGVVHADVVPAPLTGAPTIKITDAPGLDDTPVTAAESCGSATPIVSEGDAQLRADDAREAFDIDGTGVTVGVLSDSYDVSTSATTDAGDDIASGDLPGPGNPCGRTQPVRVLDEATPTGGLIDEGRGMAQIVHDVAPGAEITFATAFEGADSFAANIRALAADGAEVIVDDVTYFAEPFFQSGVIDQAVAEVTAGGASYFSSAGNSNVVIGGNNVSSWEAPSFRGASCPVLLVGGAPTNFNGTGCMDFDPTAGTDTTYGITVAPGGSLLPLLQWAEPQNAVQADIDLYLLRASDGELLAQSEADNSVSGNAFEGLSWVNGSASAIDVDLVVNRYSGATSPRLKLVFMDLEATAVEYGASAGGDVVGPTVFGHNGGPSTISAAAARYDNDAAPEAFSSRGPVTHYIEPSTATGSAPLGAPLVIDAPTLTASNGGANTFFGSLSGGTRRFFGTSAAAPHAAAVGALMKSRNYSLTPAQVRARLTGNAKAMPGHAPSAVGAGLVDAYASIDGLAVVAPPTPPTLPQAPAITQAVAGRGSVTVSFTAPTSTTPITRYDGACSSTGGGVPASASTTPAGVLVVAGLTAGVPYRCTIAAVNAAGQGPASAASAAVVPTGRPQAATRVKAKAKKKRKVQVTWTAPANTGGLPVKYQVRCTPLRKGAVRGKTVTGTSTVIKKLSPRKNYRCWVNAKNDAGGSASIASKKFKAKK